MLLLARHLASSTQHRSFYRRLPSSGYLCRPHFATTYTSLLSPSHPQKTRWLRTPNIKLHPSATLSKSRHILRPRRHTRQSPQLKAHHLVAPEAKTTMFQMISRYEIAVRILSEDTHTDLLLVRGLRCRGHAAYQNAVHPQSLRHTVSSKPTLRARLLWIKYSVLTLTSQHRPNPRHHGPQFRLLLERRLQKLDTRSLLDDVGITIRRHRIHAPHILETQILPNEPPLPDRFYGPRSIFHLGHRVFLRVAHRTTCPHPDHGYFPRPDGIRLSVQVRLHELDAISVRWTLGLDPVRIRWGVLPI